MNLADAFVDLAQRWPERTALVSPGLTLSYAQLAARAAQAARELRQRDVRPGANVGIGIRSNAETLVSMIALWMLGATAVPIDFRATAAERNLLASEFDLYALIEDRRFPAPRYESILVDGSWSDQIARHDSSPLPNDAGDESLAMIGLTSGTTGRPVGIILDHARAWLRFTFDRAQDFGPVMLNPLPLSFSASRTHTFAALFKGSAVYFHPLLFSAPELAEAALTSKATSICTVPTIVRSWLEMTASRSGPLFDSLEALYCFGAPMHAAEKLASKARLSSNFIQEYGASFCGRITALRGADIDAKADTVGRPLANVEVQVVDEVDRILPAGAEGLVRVRSPGMALQTYGDNTRTDSDRLKDGWAYTGDIGLIDQDGFVRLLARSSDLIIRAGANVHPAEVEAVLAGHAGVKEVAVVGFAKSREGEEIAAFVIPAGAVNEADLVAHCRIHLTPDKRPRRFVFVTDLPRNTVGKILRTELRERLQREEGA
jgi:acyl-CoA synthetase (AMP-forming)/AMP-acid ligase II